jgi:hypothetical protein
VNEEYPKEKFSSSTSWQICLGREYQNGLKYTRLIPKRIKIYKITTKVTERLSAEKISPIGIYQNTPNSIQYNSSPPLHGRFFLSIAKRGKIYQMTKEYTKGP